MTSHCQKIFLCSAQLPISTSSRFSISGLGTKRLTSILNDVIYYCKFQKWCARCKAIKLLGYGKCYDFDSVRYFVSLLSLANKRQTTDTINQILTQK
jgi:hypothetical protein